MTLVERVQGIIMKPKDTWPVLAAESQTVGSLYVGYIAPLAAIGPIASLIGTSLLFTGILHLSWTFGIVNAVVSYVVALIAVFVTALIAEVLAPSFGGTKDRMQALKLIAYAQTPAWIAGILLIFTPLGIIVLLAALYGLYVLYLGVSPVMNVPADKAAGYTIVLVIVSIVIYICIAVIVGLVRTTAMVSLGG
jgi:hypothetical protein